MYDQLMVDLETLGTKPGAVILSVALVEWNWKGEIGKKGVFKIPLAESVAKGFVIEPETVKWWNGQDKEVFAEALNYESCLGDFTIMMNFFAEVIGEKAGVWGNGSGFDLVLLRAYFDKYGYHTPWSSWTERDVRTIVSLLPEVKKEWKFEGTKHDPVDDCLNQIGYLVETVKRFLDDGNKGTSATRETIIREKPELKDVNVYLHPSLRRLYGLNNQES